MKRNYQLFALTLVTSVLLFIYACSPGGIAVSSVTPEPSLTAVPTSTPTATPSATPTAIPTPAVDEYGFTEERKAELNQQIQDFLNKEGNYTEESLAGQLLTGQSNEIFYKGTRKLGLMDETPRIQCWLFDYFMWEERLMLIVGLDGKSDERFVTLLEIPVYFYDRYEPATFIFTQLVGHSLSSQGKSAEPHCSIAQMKDYLDLLKNHPIIITFRLEKFPDSWLVEAQSVGEYAVEFVNQGNSRVDASRSLVASVFANGIDLEIDDLNKVSIFYLSDISELANIDLSSIVMLSVDIIFSLKW